MLRASIVDLAGNLVADASHNVTFSVVSGPGRIIGVGNGDPVSHERNKASWRSAHHGLARAVVQTTVDLASADRARKAEIDVEGSMGQVKRRLGSTTLLAPKLDPIVVEAYVEGLGSARITIPVSTDGAKDSVTAVAARSHRIDLDLH